MEAAARHEGARPAWIIAKRQTGARGRSGKTWQSPEGNLAVTWTASVSTPFAERPLFSFSSALALYDTLAVWVDRTRLAVKWPNDVLVDGCKIAGILLESVGDRLSVGIGLNIVAAPPRSSLPAHALPAVALADVARPDAPLPVQADWVLHQLAIDFDRWRGHLEAGDFDSMRQIWKRRAANLGKPVRVVLPKETIEGLFADVDESGQLVLQTTDGPRIIAAGDVFF